MIKRRRFLQLLSAETLLTGSAFPVQDTRDQATAKLSSPEQWMDTWMKSLNRGGEGQLVMGRFLEPIYFLNQPITWNPNPEQKGYQPVTAPVGFVTDLASIPRVFYSALRPDGQYAYPAIIHDYLYWTQTRSREVADMIFKFAMLDFEVDRATVETIYQAVRLGGGPSWDNNQELKRKGEKRILKKFPPNARTRWTAWKNDPSVF